MGRYYDGDILGKFWFGQSSDDIQELVGSYILTQNYEWKSCGCYVDEEVPDGKYCKECYDSIESHILEVEKDGSYEDKLLYEEAGVGNYALDKDTHYQELIDSMNKLKVLIHPDIISDFDKIEENDNILDTFTGVFNHAWETLRCKLTKCEDDIEKHKAYEILARYTLGYQIEYCLRMNDTCNISCEY